MNLRNNINKLATLNKEGKLFLFQIREQNVYWREMNTDGIWGEFSSFETPDVTIMSIATIVHQNVAFLFGLGDDDKLYYTSRNNENGQWSHWIQTSETLKFSNTAVESRGQYLFVFGVHLVTGELFLNRVVGTNSWEGWSKITNIGQPVNMVATGKCGDSHTNMINSYVFVKGQDHKAQMFLSTLGADGELSDWTTNGHKVWSKTNLYASKFLDAAENRMYVFSLTDESPLLIWSKGDEGQYSVNSEFGPVNGPLGNETSDEFRAVSIAIGIGVLPAYGNQEPKGGGKLFIFALDQFGTLYNQAWWAYSKSLSTPWVSNWENAPKFSSITTGQGNNQLFVFGIGLEDGILYMNLQDSDGNWSGWVQNWKWTTNNINTSTWMQQLDPFILDKPLKYIALPGTHDSGTSSMKLTSKLTPDRPSDWLKIIDIFLKGLGVGLGIAGKKVIILWAKTQNLNIYEQLMAGIRYFDLRIWYKDYGAIKKNRGLYICHALSCSRLEVVIEDIKRFIKDHPNEIIFLDFHKFYKGKAKEDTPKEKKWDEKDHQELISGLNILFKEKLIPHRLGTNVKVKEIWERKEQVLISYAWDGLSGKGEEYPNLWYQPSYFFNSWRGSTPPTVEGIKEQSETALKNRKDYIDKFFILSGSISATGDMIKGTFQAKKPGSLKKIAEELNPNLIDWIKNDWADKNLNIISVDFFEETNFVETVINLNKQPINIEPPVELKLSKTT